MEDKRCPKCGSKKYLVIGATLVNDSEYEKRLCCRKCETERNERLLLDSGKNTYSYIWDSKKKLPIFLHRWVWEQYHHKSLGLSDVIHHVSGIKGDNRPANLARKSKYDHTNDFMKTEAKQLYCKRCGHRWYPRQSEVRTCPKCRSPYWDKERQR